MPLAHAGLQIDADQAFGKQVVAWPVPAIVVRCRRFHRQVHQSEVFIDGDLIPDAGVAVDGPGAVFPSLIAELAGPRDGVKLQKFFASPYIKGANQALGVVVSSYGRTLLHGGADDYYVLHYGGRRMQADFAGLQIDLLIDPFDHADLQVHHAARTKRTDRSAGLGIELDQPVAGGHIEHALITISVGPVRDSTS